jgi:hypothetical protein
MLVGLMQLPRLGSTIFFLGFLRKYKGGWIIEKDREKSAIVHCAQCTTNMTRLCLSHTNY